ncbi:MAG: hypothetical protein GY822_30970, partial [Deltaproteobacteria bacterium]|nr:hypothetical protein [Deltaproteobacteria bacterium]
VSSSDVSSSGALKVVGDLRIKDLLLDVKVGLLNVPLALALVPAKIEPAPTGILHGNVQIIGVVDGKHALRVQADVNARHAKAFSLSFGEELKIQSLLSVEPAEIQVRSTSLTSSDKWNAHVRGRVELKKKLLSLHVAADVKRPEVFVAGLPKEMKIGTLAYKGEVKGPFDDVKVGGVVKVTSILGWGNTLHDVEARLLVTKKRLTLDQLAGRYSGGQLAGSVRVRLNKKSLPLDVHVQIPRIDLRGLRDPEGELLGLTGLANLEVDVTGPAKNSLTKVHMLAKKVEVKKENFGTVNIGLRVDNKELVVEKLTSQSPLLSMSTHAVRLRLEDMALSGWVQIKAADLAQIENAKSTKLAGNLKGRVLLCGTVAAPRIEANLQMQGLTTDKVVLGSGPVEVFLSPTFTAKSPILKCSAAEKTSTKVAKKTTATGLMVQAASVLDGKTGHFQLESAYLINDERLNARVVFSNVEMLPWTQKLEPDVAALDGIAEGTLQIYGKLGKLDGSAELRVANVTAQPVTLESMKGESTTVSTFRLAKELARFSTRGALLLKGKMRAGNLHATLCAFPTSASLKVPGKVCSQKERVWAEVQGPLNQKTKAFALDVTFGVYEEKLQDFIRTLQMSETKASLTASGKLRALFDGKEKSKVRTSGSILLLEQKIEAKDAPLATLTLPTQIRLFEDNTVELLSPLRYQVGDSDVVVSGTFGPKEMNAKVDGVIALATLTLLPGVFSQASGTATAHLGMKGDYSALRLDGSIEPKSGSQIMPRALKKRVVFEKGKLLFSSNPKDIYLQNIESDDLTVRIDDGRATLDGTIKVKLFEDEDHSFIVEDWDLLLVGSGLRFRSATTQIETAMNLSLRGPFAKPILKGRLEVTDGKATESFSMEKFVIESAPSEPSKPLVETLALASLENLLFDVDVDVRSFHAQANIASFLLEADLTGAVHLEDSARLYSVVGAIEASRGSFQFPYANFELTQTRVEFPRGSNGIEPRVYILASADLDPARTGFNSETQCVLELAGDTNRMALGLEAADAERTLTDTELLKFVLFGFPLAQQGDADPDAAVRAVSGELTAAFTNEVESAIARELGADLKFNVFAESDRVATGVKYQVGQRIDFEGETGLGVENGSDTHIRMRLLIFDHLPSPLPFRELAVGGEIEASSGGASTQKQAGAGNLRLSLRFFEQ